MTTIAAKTQKSAKTDDYRRPSLIEAITAPLGFFVLALLIVETFLATVLIGANLPPEQKMTGMWAGIGMFVLVTVAVYSLVWFKPANLTYDKHAHLVDRGKVRYGSDMRTVTPDKLFAPEQKEQSS